MDFFNRKGDQDMGSNLLKKDSPDARTIVDWLVEKVSELAKIPSEKIDINQPFRLYGLNSRSAVILSGDLEDWLGRKLTATLAYDYPTIALLAEYLAQQEVPLE